MLKSPHFVRFLSSFSAKYRRRCYMGCYIFSFLSGLPHALFEQMHLLAVHALQPISLKRSMIRVQLNQYGALATHRWQSSRTSLKETMTMCCYLATERQNKQATDMKTSDNGGFIRQFTSFSRSVLWEYMSSETQHMYSGYLPSFLTLLSSCTSCIPALVTHFISVLKNITL